MECNCLIFIIKKSIKNSFLRLENGSEKNKFNVEGSIFVNRSNKGCSSTYNVPSVLYRLHALDHPDVLASIDLAIFLLPSLT